MLLPEPERPVMMNIFFSFTVNQSHAVRHEDKGIHGFEECDATWNVDGLKFFIFLLDNVKDFIPAGSVDQSFFKRFVFQQPRYAGKHFEMQPGRVFGGHQKKKNMGRFAVHGLEVDAISAQAKTQDNVVEIFQFAMGNADAAADTRASQTFTFQKHPDKTFLTDVGTLATGATSSSRIPFLSVDCKVFQNGFLL